MATKKNRPLKHWEIAALNGVSLVRGGDGSTENAAQAGFTTGVVEGAGSGGVTTGGVILDSPNGIITGGPGNGQVTPATRVPGVGQQNQAEPPGGGQRMFTAEEVAAAQARARQEEKDKLYPTIDELKGKVGELTAAQQALREREEQERQEAEAAAEAARQEQLSEVERLREEQQRQSEQFASLQQELAARDAMLEQERALAALNDYRQRRMAEEGGNIMPHLIDMVGGNSPEEIEASIASLRQRTEAIMADVQASTAGAPPSPYGGYGASVTAPPVGPMEAGQATRQLSAAEIKAMSPAEYGQYREQLLAAARNRGPYGGR